MKNYFRTAIDELFTAPVYSLESFSDDSPGWYGVDLDGVLAFYDDFKGDTVIGEPIPMMVNNVKDWLSQGIEVRIFTARVTEPNPDILQIRRAIEDWCFVNIGVKLAITNIKDKKMVMLFDDRAVRILKNKGVPCCGT